MAFASMRPRLSSGPCPADPAPPRVLVVDDDGMVRRVLVRMLRRKYAVSEMPSAEAVLEAIHAGEHFDAILCDLHLDGMSGRDLLARLRVEAPAQASRLIILSGSCSEFPDDPILSTARWLEKPATLSAIEESLAELLTEPARAA